MTALPPQKIKVSCQWAQHHATTGGRTARRHASVYGRLWPLVSLGGREGAPVSMSSERVITYDAVPSTPRSCRRPRHSGFEAAEAWRSSFFARSARSAPGTAALFAARMMRVERCCWLGDDRKQSAGNLSGREVFGCTAGSAPRSSTRCHQALPDCGVFAGNNRELRRNRESLSSLLQPFRSHDAWDNVANRVDFTYPLTTSLPSFWLFVSRKNEQLNWTAVRASLDKSNIVGEGGFRSHEALCK